MMTAIVRVLGRQLRVTVVAVEAKMKLLVMGDIHIPETQVWGWGIQVLWQRRTELIYYGSYNMGKFQIVDDIHA